jgi:hypothetical protein
VEYRRDFPRRHVRSELYSETFLEHGYAPLPEYQEPMMGPRSRPDLAARFPLILTSVKHTLFCESQHRALPSKLPEGASLARTEAVSRRMGEIARRDSTKPELRIPNAAAQTRIVSVARIRLDPRKSCALSKG